jgi:NAD+ diphosphatase
MIGCIAEALTTDIHIDREELEDAQWFGRETMRAAVARAATITDPLTRPPEDDSPLPILPAPMAIAHQLIRWWVEEG